MQISQKFAEIVPTVLLLTFCRAEIFIVKPFSHDVNSLTEILTDM
jgi:hypothetical protein